MSLIKTKTGSPKALAKIFRSDFLAIVSRLKSRRIHPLGPGFDKEANTYFHARPKGKARAKGLEFPSFHTREELQKSLAEFWNGRNRPALAEMSGTLAAVAEELRHVDSENANVSPFLYVMF